MDSSGLDKVLEQQQHVESVEDHQDWLTYEERFLELPIIIYITPIIFYKDVAKSYPRPHKLSYLTVVSGSS